MISAAGRLGATPTGDDWVRFEVWAPDASRAEVVLADGRLAPLQLDDEHGTWVGTVDTVRHGDRYQYRLDGGEPLADPASGCQPDGVLGASAVVDSGKFTWTDDAWTGVTLTDTVLYELHVGTFTPEGTLDAAIAQLDRLATLGVTAVELMPVNAFPGRRNWGYDGVFPSAVQHSYGGPEALARFVDAAHARGLAVVLDVVYNHIGPEGAVITEYGPYFTATYQTPWGDGLNVAEAGSDHVRRAFIESAVRWIADFHVDGLRIDAIDTIYDPTALPFLEQLVDAVHGAGAQAGRTVLTFVESAANNPHHLRLPTEGGIGSDAAWNDDVHHSLRVALTGDRRGYYVDYDGAADLAHALEHRWVLTGRYSPFRGRHHGRAADDIDFNRFVVFASNHDHVGNTPGGARPPYDDRQRLVAAAATVVSPFTPMLFQGEEYGETRPFPYFVDHHDPALRESVRQGRRQQFGREWPEAFADPGDPATFDAAVLDPSVVDREPHRSVLAAFTELLALRRRHDVLHDPAADHHVELHGDVIVVDRAVDGRRVVLVLHLGRGSLDVPVRSTPDLTVAFDVGDPRWGTTGSPVEVTDDGLRLVGPTAVLLTACVG
ncbi:MAG: malto-oligosyltrehalose trehalohydrolase [Ilumatobacteraceae bacterium]